jgi:hypothetical protein
MCDVEVPLVVACRGVVAVDKGKCWWQPRVHTCTHSQKTLTSTETQNHARMRVTIDSYLRCECVRYRKGVLPSIKTRQLKISNLVCCVRGLCRSVHPRECTRPSTYIPTPKVPRTASKCSTTRTHRARNKEMWALGRNCSKPLLGAYVAQPSPPKKQTTQGHEHLSTVQEKR